MYFDYKTGLSEDKILCKIVTFMGIPNTSPSKVTFGGESIVAISLNIYAGAAK